MSKISSSLSTGIHFGDGCGSSDFPCNDENEEYFFCSDDDDDDVKFFAMPAQIILPPTHLHIGGTNVDGRTIFADIDCVVCCDLLSYRTFLLLL